MSVLDWIGLGKKARAYIVVRGQVYEGGYHLFVERMSRLRGLKGWMRVVLRPMDNYLEMEVESQRSTLEKMLPELRKGPAMSQISKVEVEWRNYEGTFNDFRLRN